MLRDNLVELIEPMLISAGADPLALCIHNQPQASDDRCLENPRPAGVEPSLTENVTSPFQAEPAHPRLQSMRTLTAAADGERQKRRKQKQKSYHSKSEQLEGTLKFLLLGWVVALIVLIAVHRRSAGRK